jgi:hypothetical protein
MCEIECEKKRRALRGSDGGVKGLKGNCQNGSGEEGGINLAENSRQNDHFDDDDLGKSV